MNIAPSQTQAVRQFDVAPRALFQDFQVSRGLPVLLILLGFAVMLGWVTHMPVLTQVSPGLTSMVFNTALCFFALGTALALPRTALQPPPNPSLVLAAAVLVLALLNLAQIFGGFTLGINGAGLHDWMLDGNPRPGQMSSATTIAYILASSSLLLLCGKAAPSADRRRVARAMLILLGLTGSCSVAGYLLHLEPLFGNYLFNRMALHTAVGMCVLTFALWLAWDERSGKVSTTEEGRLLSLGGAMLVSVALLTGLIGFSIFRDAYQNELTSGLTVGNQARINVIATTLDLRSTRAGVMATRPELRRAARALIAHPSDSAARTALLDSLESFLPLGFSRIDLRSLNGRTLLAVGQGPETAELEIPVQTAAPGLHSLLWRHGFVLRSQRMLRDARGELAMLESEQPLPNLLDTVMNLGEVGSSGDFQLCATEAAGVACFPSRQHSEPRHLSPHDAIGIVGATSAASGPFTRQASDPSVLRASGMVATTGLLAATQLNTAEFYGPIRSRLAWGGAALGLVITAGVLLLRRGTRPLVAQLAKAEGRHRAVVESLQEGIVVLDQNSRIVSCNDAGRRMLGYPSADLRGLSAEDPRWRVVHDDGSPWPPDELPTVQTLRNGVSQSDVLLGVHHPEGSLHWLNFSTALLHGDASDGQRSVIASFTDVTARLAAERKAEQTENRFGLLVDSVADYAILMLDTKGNIVSWNCGAQRIKGYGAEEIIGSHFSRFYPEADKEARKPETALQLAAEHDHYQEEGWRVRKDGSTFWASVTVTAVRDSSETLVGFSKVTRDLTERRAAEEAVRQSEERYRMLIDGVADGVIGIDDHGIVESLNPAAEQIFGIEAASMIGRSIALLMPERARAGYERQLEDLAHKDEARTTSLRQEVTGLRGDGFEFPMILALRVTQVGLGPLKFVGLVSDLSERRRAEQALAEALRRLRSMVQSAPFAIITSDVNGVVDCFNPAAERLTHYASAEIVGGSVQPIHLREEVVARASELSKELNRIVEPGLEVFTYLPNRGVTDEREWTYVRKGGEQVPVHLAISAMRDVDDSIVGYMGVAYDISERKRREEYTHHVAHHDFLTGLPMRSLLNDRMGLALARARRDNSKVGVIMLDLDHFKRINDSLGHHVGDELLRTVADRLTGCVRACDTVARLGGDEFVILLPDVRALANVERIAEQVIERVSAAVTIGSHELHMTPSLGIAVFPDHCDDVDELLRDADTAMYRAKAAGRCGYQVFTIEMKRAASDRMALENALRRALERQELEVHYQPQIGLETGKVIGMEALVRWTDPRLGPISPATFIPVAEESELILALGEWVLRKACRDARLLQARTGVPLRLAVNLSSHQFAQQNLIEIIRSALSDSQLSPKDLELEITEGVLMKQTELAIERLTQIRALGVTIAIDDFGTGYSSLSYVTRFPIDTLKIDRSFISKVNESAGDAAVANAVIALARSLDVNVVAEGVETVEQLTFLRDRCCDAAQGYLFGKAVPNEKFSVQGWHFGKACSANELAESFPALTNSSLALMHAVLH